MGATTFSRSKRNRARLARAAGNVEEAEALDKAGAKFRPKNDSEPLDGLAKDQDAILKPTFNDVEGVEVDLDGDGKPDIVIQSK